MHQVRHTYPGESWEWLEPSEAGMCKESLKKVSHFMGGRGCVSRYGYMVYSWGDEKKREDVASAAKTVISHFLFLALQEGKISSLDEAASIYEPRLKELNKNLGYKDSEISLRHMANQISCYGVLEKPGTAFCYNDWQMALFWDILFLKIYKASYSTVDEKVLHPLLTEILQCEDNPTFLAFGTEDRPGRLAISPRDFARFGLLYMRKGNWDGRQLLDEKLVQMAVKSPLPLDIPRAGTHSAEMIAGQRTYGSKIIPDNQLDHEGSYSWLWWVNGTGRDGSKYWPDATNGTFAACGHRNAKRGLLVIPEMDLVMSWNDTKLAEMPEKPRPLNIAAKLLTESCKPSTSFQ